MAAIRSVVPLELTALELSSSSEYIIRRRQSEIPANESSNFGSVSNVYRTQFNIGSSGVEWLDGPNCYFKCNLTVAAATATANTDIQAYLDEGGIHSLIKSVEIRLRNGTRLEFIENYNKYYSVLSNLRHSPDHIESVESHLSGDSMGHFPAIDPYRPHPADTVIPVANELKITADTDGQLYRQPRALFANGTQHTAVFKLASNFLNNIKYLPLPMLQQLQIVIEWERASLGMFMHKKATANPPAVLGTPVAIVDAADTINYTVSSPVFVANLVEPSPSVVASFEKMYKESSVDLYFLSHRTQRKIETSAAINMEVSTQFRSARYVLSVICQDEAFAESGNAKGYPSNSTFRKSGMTSFVYKSGGMRFPEHGPINTSVAYGAEALNSALIAVKQHGSIQHDTRIRPWQFVSDYNKKYYDTTGLKTIADSTKFIIGASLCRGGDFTGADLTQNTLFLEATFDAGAGANTYVGNKNVLTIIGFDAVLSLSARSGAVLRY